MWKHQILLVLLLNIAYFDITFAKNDIYIPIRIGSSYYDSIVHHKDGRQSIETQRVYEDYVPRDNFAPLSQDVIQALLKAKGGSIGIGYDFSDDCSLECNYLFFWKNLQQKITLQSTQASQTPLTSPIVATASAFKQDEFPFNDPWQTQPTTIRLNTRSPNNQTTWPDSEKQVEQALSQASPLVEESVLQDCLTSTYGPSISLKLTVLPLHQNLYIYGIASLSHLTRTLKITNRKLKYDIVEPDSCASVSNQSVLCHLGIGIRWRLHPNLAFDASWISSVKRYELSNNYKANTGSNNIDDSSNIHWITCGFHIHF